MSLPRLKIIPAGAGSGKTYTLQQQLGEWVSEGLVRPERIVAVTFTEAAAAELKERIGSQLLELGRVEDALRLEEAYVSTIHGFGLRILTEFAFEAGSSPQPRLLNQDEQDALIRLALARTSATDEITENLEAFGYKFDWNSKKTAEDGFREDVLRVIGLLRATGWQGYSEDYVHEAVAWIAERYGPVGEAEALSRPLRASVDAAARSIPGESRRAVPDQQDRLGGTRPGLPELEKRAGQRRARSRLEAVAGPARAADSRSVARRCPSRTTISQQR